MTAPSVSGQKRIVARALVLVALALAGCSSSQQSHLAASSRLVPVAGRPAGKIVLTAQGAQRLGVQTAIVRSAPSRKRAAVIIPFSAIVYDADGRTYAFTNPAPLTFTEVPVAVDHITGGSAFLRRGPPSGTKVVTVGAEELFGVQTGVLGQT